MNVLNIKTIHNQIHVFMQNIKTKTLAKRRRVNDKKNIQTRRKSLKQSKLMFGSSNVIGTLEDFHIHKIPKNEFDKTSLFISPAFHYLFLGKHFSLP